MCAKHGVFKVRHCARLGLSRRKTRHGIPACGTKDLGRFSLLRKRSLTQIESLLGSAVERFLQFPLPDPLLVSSRDFLSSFQNFRRFEISFFHDSIHGFSGELTKDITADPGSEREGRK